MSRIDDSWEPEDNADFLRSCAFGHNIRQALNGKKGLKFFKEIETALLALPEKRLIEGGLSKEGDVCVLGAVAVKRETDAGHPRVRALAEVEKSVPSDPDGMGSWGQIQETAEVLKISHPLAYGIIETNDDMFGRRCKTPEERYEKVLAWVQSKLRPAATK